MAALNAQTKLYIIQQLAMFATPQEVVDLVKENFNIELARAHVFYYDAEMNTKLAQGYKDLFAEFRQKFLENTAMIPIANKAYRIRELQKIYESDRNSKNQNKVAMRATLEQAAKESGDAFSNKQKIEQSGIIQTVTMTRDEWRKEREQTRLELETRLKTLDDAER